MKKFTIIVPTVNRPETLYFCLKTLENLGDDYEVLITDDQGAEENFSVSQKFLHHSNFKYIRTPKRLGMRGNYEYSVECSKGEYVTILGDDDGFCVNALNHVRNFLNAGNNPDVIFWWPHMYWWPNALIKQKQWMLYISNQQASPHIEAVDPKIYSAQLYNDGKNYWQFERLPSIYNGFVNKNYLDKLKNKTGNYFMDEIPDVYSGIANSAFAETAYFVHQPLTVRGISGKSFGVAFRNPNGKSIADDFKAQMKQSMCAPELVDSTALAVHIASVKLRALQTFPNELKGFTVNAGDVIEGILSEALEGQGRHDVLYQDATLLAEKYGFKINNPIDYYKIEPSNQKLWGIGNNLLSIYCKPINVDDIEKASKLIYSITGN